MGITAFEPSHSLRVLFLPPPAPPLIYINQPKACVAREVITSSSVPILYLAGLLEEQNIMQESTLQRGQQQLGTRVEKDSEDLFPWPHITVQMYRPLIFTRSTCLATRCTLQGLTLTNKKKTLSCQNVCLNSLIINARHSCISNSSYICRTTFEFKAGTSNQLFTNPLPLKETL